MVSMIVLAFPAGSPAAGAGSREAAPRQSRAGGNRVPDYRQMDPLICNFRAVFWRHSFRYSPK
jgi:hypothetical protein